jgi:multiple sugar transport system permease protein
MINARKTLSRGFAYFILILACLVIFFPLFWLFTGAIKESKDLWAIPPIWLFKPTLKHFILVLIERHFVHHLINSLVVAAGSTGISIFLGSLAAYALARFVIKGSKHISFWIISLRMMPPIVVILPLYIFFSRMRLIDTHIGLILAHITLNLPFAVWMLMGFLQEVPKELEDAALVDGCTRFGVLYRILMPVILPGLAATAVFCMIWSWNDFIFAFSLTSTQAATLPVPISGFLGDYIWEWSAFYAGGSIAAAPIIIMALLTQKYLVRGLTFGAVR